MKYSINIPDFLIEKLKRSIYNNLVEDILSNYSEWISRNETIFFREYTDHGKDHLENLLETSVLLLTENSKKLFTDSDACLLVVSVILHDVALHIQENQFLSLIDKSKYSNYNKELDSEAWHSLWIKYSIEATRFSQSQLQLFFGVNENITLPELNKINSWTPLQYQLIGEFLRRNHSRLAHDFAVFGFPVIENGDVLLIKTQNEKFRKFIDLAGLVARSHGTPIRSLFEYLKTNFGHLRDQDGAHAIYIMVILRIADFLQLQSSRAPKSQMIIKNIRTPLSRREWSVHAAILNIIYDQHEDPESVEIIVDPAKVNIELFLRIEELLNLIQKELDYSWAVLGEVYGRFKEHELGLTIRRVRSNINNKIKFGKQAGFVTEKSTFTAADAELLKLFIKPLYGDRPEIAVRELIQNSIDAVRERLLHQPSSTDIEISPSIIVSIHKLENSKWMLKVEDKGIGMSLSTITKYFLNAGASYRLSAIWKKMNLDETGRSKVLRSGRFGVGALAAFMLADDPTKIEMRVLTRHIDNPQNGAFEFTTKLTDSPIQISFAEKSEPGTIIEVFTTNPPAFMQESTKDKSDNSWDWFCLDYPIVERISSNGKRLDQSVNLPSTIESSGYFYHWIFPKDYEAIGWTFYEEYPRIVCNGIIVLGKDDTSSYSLADGLFASKILKMNMPSISIFDRDARLPITLDRLRIEYDQLQFLGDLRKDIEKNILAFILIAAPDVSIFDDNYSEEPLLDSHPAFNEFIKKLPWLHTTTGTIIYCSELVHLSKTKYIYEIVNKDLFSIVKTCLSNEKENISISVEPYSLWDDLKYYKNIQSLSRIRIGRPKLNLALIKEALENSSKKVALFKKILNGRKYEKSADDKIFRLKRELEHLGELNGEERKIKEIIENEIIKGSKQNISHSVLETISNELHRANNSSPRIDREMLGDHTTGLNWQKLQQAPLPKNTIAIPLCEFVIDENFRIPTGKNYIARIWLEYIGEVEIPFNETERNKLISKISDKYNVARHIEHWKNELVKIKNDRK